MFSRYVSYIKYFPGYGETTPCVLSVASPGVRRTFRNKSISYSLSTLDYSPAEIVQVYVWVR